MAKRTPGASPAFSSETFRFFRDLTRNNSKQWMDANRERYRGVIVHPFHQLFERMLPTALRLGDEFDTSGRTPSNFSRINRDIRFANDKTPYRSQMYLRFPHCSGVGGELYVGVAADDVTAGFRMYGDHRKGPLVEFARPRASAYPEWLARQGRRLGRRYESYWYSTERGKWTKHAGWPVKPEEWKKLRGWVVRRRMKPAAACRSRFSREIERVFQDLNPLFRFTSLPAWKP